MSRFDTVTIAAHQAAINFATTLYMIPLSICISLTILVGFETGSGRQKDARQYAIMGIGLAAILSLATALLLLFAGNHVAGLYSDEPDVISLIQHFLIYAIFFKSQMRLLHLLKVRFADIRMLTQPLSFVLLPIG